MTNRERRLTAAVIAVGLLAATLLAGPSSVGSAAKPGCEPTETSLTGDTGQELDVSDDPYDRPSGMVDTACAIGLASSMCAVVLRIAAPLASRQALGAASLCRTMSLLAQLR